VADVTTCSGCGQPIRWVLTVGGARMPIDVDPHPDGNVIPVTVDGKQRAKVLTGAELPAQEQAWRAHFATCSQSKEFKRKKARLTPTCRTCSGPMDIELARLEKWLHHPSCDPMPAPDWRKDGRSR